MTEGVKPRKFPPLRVSYEGMMMSPAPFRARGCGGAPVRMDERRPRGCHFHATRRRVGP
ncbi:hypothetical protein BO443_40433 [Burkholderia orbicola]